MKRFMIVMLVLMLGLTACNDNPNGGLIITNPAKQPFTASEVNSALDMKTIIADMTSEDAEEKGISVIYDYYDGNATQFGGVVPQSNDFVIEIKPGIPVIVATVEFNRYVCNEVTLDGKMIILFKLKSSDQSGAIESYSASASDLTITDGRKQSTVAIEGFSGSFAPSSAYAGMVQGTEKYYVKEIESNAVTPTNNGTLTVDGETVSKVEASGSDNLNDLIANAVDGKLLLAAKEYTLDGAVTVDDTLTINGVEGTTIKANATITVSATGNLAINNVDIDGSGLAGNNDRIIASYGSISMVSCNVKGRGYIYTDPQSEDPARTAIGVAVEGQSKGVFKDCNFSEMICGISAAVFFRQRRAVPQRQDEDEQAGKQNSSISVHGNPP